MNVWNLILYQPLLNLLMIFYNFLGHNMGIAIIALTLLVRLALVPSTMKSLIAQKKMKKIQPELEKIRKDHGHDQQKMVQAQLELYQRYGINPFSSCLPLLIQLPIFIALYQVFFRLTQISHPTMLYSFVPKPDFINTRFLWLDLAKPDPFYILPILAGIAMFWQSRVMTPAQSPINNQQFGDKMADFQKILSQQMIYLFPLMTVFIAIKLPSALALYWAVTTLFGIAQQYWVLKFDKDGFEKYGKKGTVIAIKKRGDIK